MTLLSTIPLERMYRGRPCIVANQTSETENRGEIFPQLSRKISNVMIRRENEIYELVELQIKSISIGMIGDTLIHSGGMDERFARKDMSPRLDFSNDFLIRLRETLNHTQWDLGNNHVIVTGLFVDESGEIFKDGHLHKLHLIHILALYGSLLED